MRRVLSVAVVGGFLVVLALGCGPSNRPMSTAKDGVSAQNDRIAAEAGGVKVYTKAEDLLSGMPKESYPFGGAVEYEEALKWLKANVVGKTIEWPATVAGVEDANATVSPFFVVTLTLTPRDWFSFLHGNLGSGGNPTPRRALRRCFQAWRPALRWTPGLWWCPPLRFRHLLLLYPRRGFGPAAAERQSGDVPRDDHGRGRQDRE
jgi:hypothetical protein